MELTTVTLPEPLLAKIHDLHAQHQDRPSSVGLYDTIREATERMAREEGYPIDKN